MTLGFGTGQSFVKERVEKREYSLLIQTECSKVLGIPVRIECEIDENAAADDGDRKTGGAEAEMTSDGGRTGDAEAGTAGDGGRTVDAEAEMAGNGDRAVTTDSQRSDTNDDDRADTAGAGLDAYPGSVEELVGEAQDTTAAGRTGGQAANTRAGAAKDPAVQKIVEAFDGQIVTD